MARRAALRKLHFEVVTEDNVRNAMLNFKSIDLWQSVCQHLKSSLKRELTLLEGEQGFAKEWGGGSEVLLLSKGVDSGKEWCLCPSKMIIP